MKKTDVKKYTVLCVDAEPMARSAIARLVAGHPSFALAGETGSPSEARDMAQRLQPEVLIYDLGMGESLMPELLRLAHGPVLMVVVRTAGVAVLRRVLRAGATCCVGRDDNMATYESALLLVVLGRRFLGPLVEARMVDDLATCPAAALEPVEAGLSAREREIFALLGEALGTRAMAERLGLSVKTVETHLGRMKGKLGVPTRAALARRAMLAAG